MKKIAAICLIIFILTILFSSVTGIVPARAQLIVVGTKYLVKKVDIPKRRLEAVNYKKKAGIVYILVDGNTNILQDGKPAQWTKIKVGDIVYVSGGLTWEMKIRAKKIILP